MNKFSFKEFLRRDEMFDTLADPYLLGALGAAGTGALAWASRKFRKDQAEYLKMRRAWEDLEYYIEKFGVDSPEVQRHLQGVKQDVPSMYGICLNRVNSLRAGGPTA